MSSDLFSLVSQSIVAVNVSESLKSTSAALLGNHNVLLYKWSLPDCSVFVLWIWVRRTKISPSEKKETHDFPSCSKSKKKERDVLIHLTVSSSTSLYFVMLRSIFRAKAFSFLSRRRRRWSCSNTLDYRTVGEENSEASPTHDIVLSQTSSTPTSVTSNSSFPPNKKSKNKTSRKGCQQPVSCIRMSLPLHHSLFSFPSLVAIPHLFSCC